jgi:hypothetical protein
MALSAGAEVGLHTTVMASNEAGEDSAGGAMYLTGAGTRAALVSCVIQYNRAGRGGAIAAHNQPSVSIADSYLEDNTANTFGGALSLWQLSSAYMTNVQVSYNFARVAGGAMHLARGSQVVVSDSRFYRNSATQVRRLPLPIPNTCMHVIRERIIID